MSFKPLLKLMTLFLLLASSGIPGDAYSSTSKATRDWTKYPVVVEVDTTEDIYAVGDPHADYGRLVGVLTSAKIIAGKPATPSDVVWIAGKSILVITGDLIDKGTNSIKVIELVRALQQAASDKGGRVIVTMGNHEAEFLANPHGSKTKEFGDELKAAGLKRNSVANCEGVIGQFLCQLPIAARVNDWFFCHGGNTNNQSIQVLSSSIQTGFAQHGFAMPQLVGDNSILEARLNAKGPGDLPWFDNGSLKTDPQKLLAMYVKTLGVKHLVQGHQPGKVVFPDEQMRKKEEMFQRYGLLFLIDSGMSKGIVGSKSTGGALHIKGKNNQKAIVLCANGKEKIIWDSKSPVDIDAQHCGK